MYIHTKLVLTAVLLNEAMGLSIAVTNAKTISNVKKKSRNG
jgi:hypothetical protein